MKTGTTGLQTFLDSKADLTCFNIFTFSFPYDVSGLETNIINRFTDADVNLSIGGYTYYPLNIQVDSITTAIGSQVNDLNITISADETFKIYINNYVVADKIELLKAMINGNFDGSKLLLERVFYDSTGTYKGKITRFQGYIDVKELNRFQAKLVCHPETIKLNVSCPKNIIQPSCRYVLYSSACSVVKSTYTWVGYIKEVTNKYTMKCTLTSPNSYPKDAPTDAGSFNKGVFVFTTGVNAGIKKTIKYFSVPEPGYVSFELSEPIIYNPAINDSYHVYLGCDRTTTMCNARFGNLANFGGFPFCPVPETLL